MAPNKSDIKTSQTLVRKLEVYISHNISRVLVPWTTYCLVRGSFPLAIIEHCSFFHGLGQGHNSVSTIVCAMCRSPSEALSYDRQLIHGVRMRLQ